MEPAALRQTSSVGCREAKKSQDSLVCPERLPPLYIVAKPSSKLLPASSILSDKRWMNLKRQEVWVRSGEFALPHGNSHDTVIHWRDPSQTPFDSLLES